MGRTTSNPTAPSGKDASMGDSRGRRGRPRPHPTAHPLKAPWLSQACPTPNPSRDLWLQLLDSRQGSRIQNVLGGDRVLIFSGRRRWPLLIGASLSYPPLLTDWG